MTYKKITIDKQFPAISDSWIKKQLDKNKTSFKAIDGPITLQDLQCIKKPTIIRIRSKGQDGTNHTIFYTGTKDSINTETKDGSNIGKIYDSWASTFADNGDIACRDYYDNKFMESNIYTGKHTVKKNILHRV